ncbi:uncharacterized protein ACA1_289150 [Acanthamoeba castellanii str. Neff]|uniref:Uncharacterized protein n=1 Tax=Acanthamoeba castellanii (strain ATCC 30010 / Neff) TaxID=1257118 RepID=L8HKJ2_ACACF|nr:uncharacterized protein ACA1_289150 [Acanthamoeba castellanii str. Neff]ELR25183.1 hypothetical protein ACA1_289150 [Acanthamoeba castellanii str. Neff]
MSASTTTQQHVNPLDLPLPREAPPTSRRNKGIAAGLRRSLSGSITIPDSVSETALKHRNGLRRLTKRLRDVDPSLPARATSFVGMGGMIIREIRGGSRDDEVSTATTTTTTTRAAPETMVGPDGVETVIPVTPARTEEERVRQWRDSGDVTAPMSAEDLAGDALVHLTQRLASVVPMKGLNKPVGSVLVGNHRKITSRWLELSRIAADVKKHNAHLDSLRARSRDYASVLQTSSQTAVTLRERVRAVLVAIQGIESAAAFQDAQNMNAYLQLLNEEANVIAQRQEQLMAGLMQDAEMIAKSARRAHSRSSLFAVSALGALAAGVVLTGGAGLLVGGTVATLTAIAGGGMLTGLTCGALLDASDAHEKIERSMQEMQTVSERAGSLVEGDARVWRSIGLASRMAEGRVRSMPSVFQSAQWAQIQPQVMQSLHEAQLLRTLDIYVVYLFSSGFAIPGIDLANIMDGPTIAAARRELAAMDAAVLPLPAAPLAPM